ncbi:MAG: hypothetical protein K6B41_05270 [Butyrivibrio sp.]|nr:hypothetical protein [Butyrivibrio sp.]
MKKGIIKTVAFALFVILLYTNIASFGIVPATTVEAKKAKYNSSKIDVVVDISQHNTVTNWKKLKKKADAVILRLGYRGYGTGKIVLDAKFLENQKKCVQYKIPYSVYFYSQATTVKEAKEEADFVKKYYKNQKKLPAFIDSEYSTTSRTGRADNLTVSERTAAVNAFCKRLKNAGIPSGVYASTNWLNTNLNMKNFKYNVWVAQYNSRCTYTGKYMMWQYTSSGKNYGVSTYGVNRCDVSKVIH